MTWKMSGQEYAEPFYKVVGALEGPGENLNWESEGAKKKEGWGGVRKGTEEEQLKPPPPPSARERRTKEMGRELALSSTGGEL